MPTMLAAKVMRKRLGAEIAELVSTYERKYKMRVTGLEVFRDHRLLGTEPQECVGVNVIVEIRGKKK